MQQRNCMPGVAAGKFFFLEYISTLKIETPVIPVMVKYNPKTWLKLIFHAYSKHVLKTLLPASGFFILFSAPVCYLILDHLLSGVDVKANSREQLRSTPSTWVLCWVCSLCFGRTRLMTAGKWTKDCRGGMVNSTRNFALKLGA